MPLFVIESVLKLVKARIMDIHAGKELFILFSNFSFIISPQLDKFYEPCKSNWL